MVDRDPISEDVLRHARLQRQIESSHQKTLHLDNEAKRGELRGKQVKKLNPQGSLSVNLFKNLMPKGE